MIRPVNTKIVVAPVIEEKTASGIIIAAAKEKPQEGTVVAVSDHVTIVEKGDSVFFSIYGYDEVEYNGETFYIVDEKNILAIK